MILIILIPSGEEKTKEGEEKSKERKKMSLSNKSG